MPSAFDPAAIEAQGWRQGSVLGPVLRRAAESFAPSGIAIGADDWLVVTSHDCDIANGALNKEPTVEVLRAEMMPLAVPDSQQAGGRNPRSIQFRDAGTGRDVVLRCRVHERWLLPRELLVSEAPTHHLDRRNARLIAEWLAKRYIRAAFPTAFDDRWRGKMKEWLALVQEHSEWMQGIYLRLSTLEELDGNTPYRCHLIVATPFRMTTKTEWAARRLRIEAQVEEFWTQFPGAIAFDGVEVVPTNRLTLADIENYQRFDADWVSFADDTPTVPIHGDMPA